MTFQTQWGLRKSPVKTTKVIAFQGFTLTNVKAILCPAVWFLSSNVLLALWWYCSRSSSSKEMLCIQPMSEQVCVIGNCFGDFDWINRLIFWKCSSDWTVFMAYLTAQVSENAALYHFRQGQQGRPLLSSSFPHILWHIPSSSEVIHLCVFVIFNWFRPIIQDNFFSVWLNVS